MIELKPSVSYNSKTVKLKTGCGSLYMTLVYDADSIIRVFLQLGKMGGCVRAHLSILSGYVNNALSYSNIDAIKMLTECTGITCQESNSCIEVTVRFLLDTLLKIQENSK